MVYLRARYYAPGTGRFLSRDTWDGNESSPLSLNRWIYVQANPVNYVDPTGNVRKCPWTYSAWAVKWRVNVAEKYVKQTSDPMDTYVAAGIAIQCAGGDEWWNPYSGVGIAQITEKQVVTEWGKEIDDIWDHLRGYGLRLRCPDGELETPLDPYNTEDAVILMKREIQLVTNECKGCTSTDIYIAAGLAQNGPGFTYKDMQFLEKLSSEDQAKYKIKMNWFDRFTNDVKRNDGINTKTQLDRFTLVIKELQSRGWYVPDDQIDFSWETIENLRNWQVP